MHPINTIIPALVTYSPNLKLTKYRPNYFRRIGFDLVEEGGVQNKRNHIPQPPSHSEHTQLLNLHEEVSHHDSDHTRAEDTNPNR